MPARPAADGDNQPPAASRGLTYADAGVSIDRGDAFAGGLRALMKRTFGPRVIENPGGFAGLFRLDYNERLFKRNYKDPVLVACADGVGTKIRLAQQLDRYDTIGIDLVAMNVNDLIVQGAEPLFFLDYIATGRIDQTRLDALMKGVSDACVQSGAALLGGETAEMPGLYEPDEMDLAGFAVGVVELKRATDATRVEPGDVVLGLTSSGAHSNGYTLIHEIVRRADLDLGRTYPEVDPARPLGDVLLTPTRLYASPIVRLQRGYRVKKVITGMAHITGGGLADNLRRALNDDVDAVLDPGAWTTPPLFAFLQDQGAVADEEMARVFNMGVGFCLIVRPAFADSIRAKLERLGETVYDLGRIEKGGGAVRFGG